MLKAQFARCAMLCLLSTAMFAASAVKPPLAPVNPVVETLWGHKVTDNYRYMEALGPDTIAWMKAQGAYTRAVLDGIGPIEKLKTDVTAFTEDHRQHRGAAAHCEDPLAPGACCAGAVSEELALGARGPPGQSSLL
jgi:hypothetical protein